jgi:hypothetical protein
MTDTSYNNLTEPEPGGPVEVIHGDPVGLATTDETDSMVALINDAKSRAVEDPEAVAKAITNRILEAESVEDVLSPQECRHARELLDVPLRFFDLHFNQSDFEEGAGFYAIANCEDVESGDRFAVACGGRNVMAQLLRLHQIGAFPIDLKFEQARRPTRQGFWPLWLVKA